MNRRNINGMKIKTAVFWILWVGNDLTLQTVGERNLALSSPPSVPSHPGDTDLASPALGLTDAQPERLRHCRDAPTAMK
jgi:hypothetical protein